MSDLESKIQKELVRRVLELDGKRQKLSLTSLAVESTVDTLEDFTDVSRDDIDTIAREVRLQYEAQPSSKQRRRKLLRDWGLKLAGAVISSLLVISIYQWMGAKQPVNATPNVSARALTEQEEKIQKKFLAEAELSSVVAALGALRPMVTMYYQEYGAYPESLRDIGLNPSEMTDNVNIKGVRLVKEGIIVAKLDSKFGKSRELALIPRSTMGGLQTRWDCITNVDASAFMNEKFRLCNLQASLDF